MIFPANSINQTCFAKLLIHKGSKCYLLVVVVVVVAKYCSTTSLNDVLLKQLLFYLLFCLGHAFRLAVLPR
jgi:uncharacterized membrane protein